jgi:hypothetical protein
VRLFSKEVLIKHFTYLFAFLAFTSIVMLFLANFSLLFLHFFFLQLEATMKLLQKRKKYIRLQQWNLPSGVSQGCCLPPGLQHLELLFLLTWRLSFENSTTRHSVPVMLSTSRSLMM